MYICFDGVHPQICQAQFAFRNQPGRHNTSPFLSHKNRTPKILSNRYILDLGMGQN